MAPNTTRTTMTNTITNTLLLGLFSFLFTFMAGCGPTFDAASLVTNTRVVGARLEVQGAPDRASPMPGETVNVTWLVTSPATTPPLGWTFAVCAPGIGTSSTACLAAPLARFDGTAAAPRISIPVPAAAVLGGAMSLTLRGGICAGVDSTPQFDSQDGLVRCTNGGQGTTVSLDMPLQQGDEANHNPIADRAFTLDGAAWPVPAAIDDPCVQGPRVMAGSKDHVIGNTTEGSDREPYTVVLGDPPVATPTRERLQISQFTTAGKLNSQFSFVEATDANATTVVEVTWDAPDVAEVSAAGTAVTFTFVVHDERGGTDWTTRELCVTP
jgi:hypothetical protein